MNKRTMNDGGIICSTQKSNLTFHIEQLLKISSSYKKMEESSAAPKRQIAVVTGANKGIGFEVCKQLVSNGITVVLTSRDEKKGQEAVKKLKKESGLSDHIVFHQLDVSDPSSIVSFADFIRTHFGGLDILVNNAGIGGVMIDSDALRKATEVAGGWPNADKAGWDEMAPQNYELAEACLKTNYYGTKRVTEAFLPLLLLSDSARIVNVSSGLGLLLNIPSERIKATLNNIENLTEGEVDEILSEFLKDFGDNVLETKGWPTSMSAYIMSKAAMNAYTRILAKNHPTICINSVHPGYAKTDITGNNGLISASEGAQNVVRLALLPEGGSSGVFFNEKQALAFS